MKEVINVAKTIKTPSIRVLIDDEFGQDKMHALEVGNHIEHTTLANIVTSSAIYYDPDPTKTIIKDDI